MSLAIASLRQITRTEVKRNSLTANALYDFIPIHFTEIGKCASQDRSGTEMGLPLLRPCAVAFVLKMTALLVFWKCVIREIFTCVKQLKYF